jgi:hypothetical protein
MSIVGRYAPVPSSTMEQHHVAFISDGQLLVSEVWDSSQQLEAFGRARHAAAGRHRRSSIRVSLRSSRSTTCGSIS